MWIINYSGTTFLSWWVTTHKYAVNTKAPIRGFVFQCCCCDNFWTKQRIYMLLFFKPKNPDIVRRVSELNNNKSLKWHGRKIKHLCTIKKKNWDFRRSAYWFCGTDLGTPEKRNLPLKSRHLATLYRCVAVILNWLK